VVDFHVFEDVEAGGAETLDGGGFWRYGRRTWRIFWRMPERNGRYLSGISRAPFWTP
jgi:hypothetical protein